MNKLRTALSVIIFTAFVIQANAQTNWKYDFGIGINRQLKQDHYSLQGFQPTLQFGLLKSTKFERLSIAFIANYQRFNTTFFSHTDYRPRRIGGGYQGPDYFILEAHSLAISTGLNYRLLQIKKISVNTFVGLGFTKSIIGKAENYYLLNSDYEFRLEEVTWNYWAIYPNFGLELVYKLNGKTQFTLSYNTAKYYDFRFGSKRVQYGYRGPNFFMVSLRKKWIRAKP